MEDGLKSSNGLELTTARDYLESDFNFVGKLKTKEIGGKEYLTSMNEECLTISENFILTETQFLNDWFNGFILGHIGKRNYFNFNLWMENTNHGTESVKVVDDADPEKVLFIIPGIAIPLFTPEERRVIKIAGQAASRAKYDFENKNKHGADEKIKAASNYIKNNVGEETPYFHEYIPRWYYESKGIIPEVWRNLIYCRDVYGLNPKIKEDWEFAKSLFEDVYNKKELSVDQLTFMKYLCGDEWVKPEWVTTEIPNPESKKELETQLDEVNDPFSA